MKKLSRYWLLVGFIAICGLVFGAIAFVPSPRQHLPTVQNEKYLHYALDYGIDMELPASWVVKNAALAPENGSGLRDIPAEGIDILSASNGPVNATIRIVVQKFFAPPNIFQQMPLETLLQIEPHVPDFAKDIIKSFKANPSRLESVGERTALVGSAEVIDNTSLPGRYLEYFIPISNYSITIIICYRLDDSGQDWEAVVNKIRNSIKITDAHARQPVSENELGLFVKGFMLDADYNKGPRPYWDIQSENYKIHWITNGTKYLKDGWTQERLGAATISANGKEFYKLAQRKIILPWAISLVGDKFGVKYVSFWPELDTFGANNSGSDFDFEAAMNIAGINFVPLAGVDMMGTDFIPSVGAGAELGNKSIFYKISYPEKKDAYVVLQGSEGSGGSSTYLFLVYPPNGKDMSVKQYKAFLENHYKGY